MTIAPVRNFPYKRLEIFLQDQDSSTRSYTIKHTYIRLEDQNFCARYLIIFFFKVKVVKEDVCAMQGITSWLQEYLCLTWIFRQI